MPELTVDDVIQYNPLFEDNDETARILAAHLAAARRYCGWPVTPVITDDEVTLDGPGGPLLGLPTLRLLTLTEVVEDGVTLDVTDLKVSRLGLVRKTSGACWSSDYGAITVTMTHGFTEAEAADWRDAVLSAVNRARLQVAGRQQAGPFSFTPESSMFSEAERDKLDSYRLLVL